MRKPLKLVNQCSPHLYEVLPRSDKRGVDLISDALPYGALCYGEPNAVSNVIDYAKFRSRCITRRYYTGSVAIKNDSSAILAANSSSAQRQSKNQPKPRCRAKPMLTTALRIVFAVSKNRGPRDRSVIRNPIEPSPTPVFQFPVGPTETKNPSPIASATRADSGNMEMTIQQFTRRYLELDGRYAEQEAFLKRADRKRVRWKVIFLYPTSQNDEVTLQFDVPAESHNEKPLIRSPVRWANFPLNFRDRLYSLKRGDLVEISGVLKLVANTLVIQGDDFDVVTAPTLTPAPRIKKSR